MNCLPAAIIVVGAVIPDYWCGLTDCWQWWQPRRLSDAGTVLALDHGGGFIVCC